MRRWMLMAIVGLLAPAAREALAAPGDFLWNRGWDATGFADLDGGGSTCAAGMFIGGLNFGGGAQFSANAFTGDVWVARYGPGGAYQWSRTFTPSMMGATVTAVTCAPNGSVYVAGNVVGGAMIDFGGGAIGGGDQMWIAKFDDLGNHLWSATFGQGTVHSLDGDQNWLAVGGDFFGNIDFGGGALAPVGGLDAFVALLHGGAAFVWQAGYGDANEQITKDVDVDANGTVVVTGCFQGNIDFGGGGHFSNAVPDLFVAKFDTTGAEQWSKNFPGDFGLGVDVRAAIAQDVGSGDVALVVTSENLPVDLGGGALAPLGGSDIVVADFDGAGSHQWSKRYGSAIDDEGQDVAFDLGGNVTITGAFQMAVSFGGAALVSNGGIDLFVAGFSPTGAFAWDKGYGTMNDDVLCRVVTDPLGNALLFGSAFNGINFGGGALADAGVYLVKVRALTAPVAAPVVAGVVGSPAGTIAPNPFADTATIRFDVPREQAVTVTVHDVTGRRVRQLADRSFAAGQAAVAWDGRDDAGRGVPGGVYYWSVRGSEGVVAGGPVARVK